ncbi:hypothetical protein [Plantactinospora sp. CA-290183]|uniref:hypothetical protein n=1 Tax=Plantactinospora sp. CA-290183 TaxID=3240006 RepID=UPI003D8FA40E
MKRRTDTRAHRYIVDHVKPGTTIRRRVEVVNASSVRRKIDLYAAAATVHGTEFGFAPERTQNELTSWTKLDRASVELGPREETRAWVTVAIPAEASAGERYGVIWAELAGDVDQDTNVRNVTRSGVRMYLSVGPGGEPPSDFEITGLTGQRRPGGTPVVSAEVRNTGGRALDLSGELQLTDGPGGLSAGPLKVDAGTLAMGAAGPVSIPLDAQLPDGPWTVQLKLVSGWVERRAEGKLTFGPAVVPAPATDRGFPPLATVASLLAALVALALLGWYARRRWVPRRFQPAVHRHASSSGRPLGGIRWRRG